MELRQLEQFVAVAEEYHFARAAARCNVVPSALSTSIRALEREMGAALLRRTTRSVKLTEAGAVFLAEARRCLIAAASARAAVGDMRNLLSGTLRIGAIPTFDLLDQPAILHRIHQEHPGLKIRYSRGTSTALLDGVRAGQLDIAVLSLPEPPPRDLTIVEIASGPVLLACNSEHRLAGRSTVSPDNLSEETFVSAPPGSRGRDYIDRIFTMAGAEPNVPYEVNDVAAMLDFVEKGLGVALVINPMAASRRALRAIPIAEASFTWTIAAVAPPTDQLAPAARVFLKMIDTELPGTGSTPTPASCLEAQ